MKRLITKYGIEVSVMVLALLFAFSKSNSSGMQARVITGDGEGYYAYLPAIFIYHDLQFEFVDEYQAKYYGFETKHKKFLTETGEGSVNKYFPGVALMWLPFFLLAHIMALLFGMEADGYSAIYQIAIAVANLFYLWCGSRLVNRILIRYGYSAGIAAAVPLLLIWATNIFFYSVYDSSLTHMPNFFLVAAMLYGLIGFKNSSKAQPLFYASLAFGLLFISRPQDGIVLLAVPLVMGNKATLLNQLTLIVKKGKLIAAAVLPPLALLGLLCGLWWLQAEVLWANSYGEERFDFSSPHLLDSVFGYRKGWLIYTPLAALGLWGLYFTWKKDRNQAYWLTLILLLAVYVTSSWWCWWYGASYGQRALIDYYALLALPLAALVQYGLSRTGIIKYMVLTAFGICTVLNLWRAWQHQNGILPTDYVNADIYWSTLLSTQPSGELLINRDLWLTESKIEDGFDEQGGSLAMPKGEEFTPVYNGSMPWSATEREALITFSFSADEVTDEVLVCDQSVADSNIYYQAIYLKDEMGKGDDWVTVSRLFDVKEEACAIKIYLWNPDKRGSLELDDFVFEELVLRE